MKRQIRRRRTFAGWYRKPNTGTVRNPSHNYYAPSAPKKNTGAFKADARTIVNKPKRISFKGVNKIGSKYYPLNREHKPWMQKKTANTKTQMAKKSSDSSVKKTMHKQRKKHLKSSSDPLDLMNKSSSLEGTPKATVDIEGTNYKVEVDKKLGHPANKTPDRTPLVYSHSMQVKQVANAAIGRNLHRTSIHTGMPMTKALKAIKKVNGSIKKTFFDSKFEYKVAAQRQSLNHSAGFNTKNFWMMPIKSAVCSDDIIKGVANISDYETSEFKKQKTYLSMEYLYSQFKIYNQSAYMPCMIKFLMIDPTSTSIESPGEVPVDALFRETFNDTLTTQQLSTIPLRDQHTVSDLELGSSDLTLTRNINLSNRASLTSSAAFRSRYRVYKTFTKKLGPGETWIINHRHYCGPGLDFQAILEADQGGSVRSQYDPIACLYAIESKGIACEAIHQDTGVRLPYLGTGPAYYTTEMRKGWKGVSVNTSSRTDINALGANDNSIHIRTFTDNPYSAIQAEKEFFALPEDLVINQTLLTDGKSYIPVVTDHFITSASTTPGESDSEP